MFYVCTLLRRVSKQNMKDIHIFAYWQHSRASYRNLKQANCPGMNNVKM